MNMRGLAGVAVFICLAAAAPATALDTLRGELHMHSDISSGDFSLDGLAELALKQGVDVLMLSENYLVRIEYGLPPFRALTRVVREERSVISYGVDRFLARVAATQRRYPRLVILPGVEVIPHYYWTGSPFDFDMTLHDTQKNLLIFGISDAATLRGLPVAGSGAARFTLSSVVDAVPALLLIPGVRFLLVKRQQRIRIARAWVVVRRRRWFAGIVLCLVGAAGLVRAWPFSGDRHPYWQSASLAPHQALIDHVRNVGGITVWSFPEARDAGEQLVGPVRVRWRTEPYPDDLVRTSRYTAFGALYEDTTTFERPGRGWDLVLGQYVRGERTVPPWAVAESGFHGFSAGKRIGQVQTMFVTRDRSETGVIDAFKRGRMYAQVGFVAAAPSLGEFTVTDGSTSAGLGERLRVAAGTPIEVRIRLDVASGTRQNVRVHLIRNGAVLEAWDAEAPGRFVHREVFDGVPTFFRGDVQGAAAILLNPIFVVPR